MELQNNAIWLVKKRIGFSHFVMAEQSIQWRLFLLKRFAIHAFVKNVPKG